MPAIYIIAAVLVLLFLIGAYRSMGAGASTDEDPKAVLVAVLASTDEAVTSLDAVSAVEGDTARGVRRRLDGCAQALERIAATPVDESLDQARSALELAVDELSWSARLTEAPGYSRDGALRDAAVTLRSRGTEQLTNARTLIGG